MNGYKFRSEESNYREPLSKIDTERKSEEQINNKPLSVPIEKEKVFSQKEVTVRLRVRKKPNGDILKVLMPGTKVEVKESKNGWTQLKDGNYVMSKFLK